MKSKELVVSKSVCEALLFQFKKNLFPQGFNCIYTGGNTKCSGIPVDYFESICKTLCMICKKTNKIKKINCSYESFICQIYDGTPKRIQYNKLPDNYNLATVKKRSDRKIALEWYNPELGKYLLFCEKLECFSYDTETKKALLSLYAFFLYGLKDESMLQPEWEKEIFLIIGKIAYITPVNYDHLKENINEFILESANKFNGRNKTIFEKFSHVLMSSFEDDYSNEMLKRILVQSKKLLHNFSAE